jgi:tetratricopeptide (TPR) repeat protein
VGIVLALAGCATPQVSQLQRHWPADVAAVAALKNVPFFPQEDYECGPASLAMMFQAAGVNTAPEQLVPQVYLPGRQGSLQVELLAASRRHGLLAYRLTPAIEDVLREVAAGHPVLVYENLSLPIYPVWHYAVVVGFDRDRNTLVLHSGKTAALEMSLFTFERTWARGGNWAIVVLPPNQLPVTAEADAFAQAAVALEPADAQAAHSAYAAALARWPDHKALLLGLGNSAYALGQWAAAANAYQAAVQVHADFADAWNNLAQVQMQLGQHQAAADAIARAVALGGPRLAQYLALAQTIQAK